uniref:UBC core domain-containing protein n=1 Tax=Panagrellus redivivus TaxID=6233 RepID=A0A7E4VBD2_PANRE
MAASRSAGLRRLMREAAELRTPTDMYFAQPLDDNLFEWHFTIRGPPDSPYEGGVYHGRITLPHEYPMKPPSLMMLTPSGRFETNTKICLSISDYHPETWQPSWSIGTALVALIAFMSTPSLGAVGSIETSDEQRKILAKKSLIWTCNACDCKMQDHLDQMKAVSAPKPEAGDAPEATKAEASDAKTAEVPSPAANSVETVPAPIQPAPESVSPATPTIENTATTTEAPTQAPAPPAPTPQTPPTAPIQAPAATNINAAPVQNNSSSAGFFIFFFSAIFFALLFRRLKMVVPQNDAI